MNLLTAGAIACQIRIHAGSNEVIYVRSDLRHISQEAFEFLHHRMSVSHPGTRFERGAPLVIGQPDQYEDHCADTGQSKCDPFFDRLELIASHRHAERNAAGPPRSGSLGCGLIGIVNLLNLAGRHLLIAILLDLNRLVKLFNVAVVARKRRR